MVGDCTVTLAVHRVRACGSAGSVVTSLEVMLALFAAICARMPSDEKALARLAANEAALVL